MQKEVVLADYEAVT